MGTDKIEAIGNTLLRIVQPNMTPKQLLKAVRLEHPKADKRDIIRAAFYSIISGAEADPEKAKELHAFAMEERGGRSS